MDDIGIFLELDGEKVTSRGSFSHSPPSDLKIWEKRDAELGQKF